MARRRLLAGGLVCWFGVVGLPLRTEIVGSPLAALPPPSDQVSADCERSIYATDRLVCETAALLALDAEMLGLWRGVKNLPGTSGFWIEPQNEWFKRRSMCAFEEDHADCVNAAYSERIAVLCLLQFPPGACDRTVTCTGARTFPSGTVVFGPDLFLLMDGQAQPRVVAMTSIDPDWTPFATAQMESGNIQIVRFDGAEMNCLLL